MAEYLTIKDAALLLRVSVRTIARWVRAGYVHPVRIGHTLRFEKKTLLWQVEKLQSVKSPAADNDPMLG